MKLRSGLLIGAILLASLPMTAQTDLLDIAAGAVVVSYSSEYGPGWAALLLIDGSTKTGWCNGKPNPNTIVIELPQLTELSRIVLDNTGAVESSYKGISARHVEIHASTSSTERFQKIATLEAVQGKRKEFPLAPTNARWLKLVILSNWGHAQYTELMELEAYGKPLEEARTAAISGVYATNYGPLLLKQFGSIVYGCYGGGNTVWGSFKRTRPAGGMAAPGESSRHCDHGAFQQQRVSQRSLVRAGFL